ncbi:putative aldouronate transport system permease protein [Paenibacillus sp. UNCCL117]|uniref:carbohydrate ABC transporter permease n=1 Tax=unclassified Paenibacillus TaxID=185978 RepID=UPI00087DF6A0|nr:MULTISPECIES: carbohydrate ABC transporter permease [unclassified Paenibacillus]SDC48731.1 putative aldouronate transport system permease protein [Paenibacillus sp. cl123]SFW11888.1 putative aldouronate transport system permease protein [Paenibacillus sp. UNCCL117]
MIRTKGENWFAVFNVAILSLVSLSMILPFIHIAAKSLSSEAYVLAKDVILWPKGLNLESYRYVLTNKQFFDSFTNSVFITVVGTAISMLLTVLAAYPLSKRNLPYGRGLMLLFVITMFFSGGLIPTYLVVKEVGLLNTLWSLILPGALAPFNLILIRNFFLSLPETLEESARIDGASNWRILWSLYIPLSMPALATISMFYAVGYWNSFFQAMMYITERRWMPLQMFLLQLVTDERTADTAILDVFRDITPETIRAAAILCVVIPILCVYPFIQKYFVKGVMLGAVKG